MIIYLGVFCVTWFIVTTYLIYEEFPQKDWDDFPFPIVMGLFLGLLWPLVTVGAIFGLVSFYISKNLKGVK
jgi:hypothetical protein